MFCCHGCSPRMDWLNYGCVTGEVTIGCECQPVADFK